MINFTVGEINIICTNLEKSLHFYRDILGFTPTQDEDGFYHMILGGRSYLLLPTAQNAMPSETYASQAQFSMDLYVDDLKVAYEFFRQKQVHFAIEWQEGMSMFVIRDPDALHWEIVSA